MRKNYFITIKTALSFIILTTVLFLPSPTGLLAAEIDVNRGLVQQDKNISAALDLLSADPSTGSITTLEASGLWRNKCVPVLESVDSSTSGFLYITAVAEPLDSSCEQTATNWHFPIEFQFDMPNYYIVELIIRSEQLGTTEVSASKEIFVQGNLVFTPQTPEPNQPILLTVTGIHRDGCVPEYASHEIVDSIITVDIMTPDSAEIMCGQALTPWQIDVDIATLDAGDYVVEAYTSDQYQNTPIDRTLYKTVTLSVGVTASQTAGYLFYLPNVLSE